MKKKKMQVCMCIVAILIFSMVLLAGCGGNTEPESEVPVEKSGIVRSPLIYVDNPQEENLADMLQEAAAGILVQIRAGNVIGSGVIWEIKEDKLIIVTAGHVLAMENGEVQVIFSDGWTMSVGTYEIMEPDLAFIAVDLQEISDEHLAQYYFANTDAECAEKLQRGDNIILMGSGTGVAQDAYEGNVIEPWIYIEDFAAHMILAEAEVKEGMSGCGLFDIEGHFLGIVCGKSEDGEVAVISLPVIQAGYAMISENF